MNDIEGFSHMFFRQAPYLILKCLDGFLPPRKTGRNIRRSENRNCFWYGSRIARETKVTYSHVHHTLQEMISVGLVRSEKVGRITSYSLTNKGQLCLYNMNKVLSLLNTKKGNTYFGNSSKELKLES
jgi:predicted transcriptional regulator